MCPLLGFLVPDRHWHPEANQVESEQDNKGAGTWYQGKAESQVCSLEEKVQGDLTAISDI